MAILIAIVFVFLSNGCKKESPVEPEPTVILSSLSTGNYTNVQQSASGSTNPLDLSSFTKLQATWSVSITNAQYRAQNEFYTSRLLRTNLSPIATLLSETFLESAKQFSVTIDPTQLPNRGNIVFEVTASTNYGCGPGLRSCPSFTIANFKLIGWKQ
jgi:hypothetical protein